VENVRSRLGLDSLNPSSSVSLISPSSLFSRKRSPDDPTTTITARLLALEGDWVSARVVPAGAPPSAPRSPIRLEVPLGHAWVEVDALPSAASSPVPVDSPSGWGPVPVALIEGRVVGVGWPVGRAGWVSSSRREGEGGQATVVKKCQGGGG